MRASFRLVANPEPTAGELTGELLNHTDWAFDGSIVRGERCFACAAHRSHGSVRSRDPRSGRDLGWLGESRRCVAACSCPGPEVVHLPSATSTIAATTTTVSTLRAFLTFRAPPHHLLW